MKTHLLIPLQRQHGSAFTLVEVMVSSALIVVVMGFLMATINETQRVIKGTTARVNQFQSSRVAFEALTRTLGQATLNTYWDLDFDASANPTGYRRQSDMHFYSGPIGDILKSGSEDVKKTYPGHGVFFQAPLGYTERSPDLNGTTAVQAKTRYAALSNALNVVGFYTEWGDGLKYAKAPKVLESEDGIKAGAQYRFRLIQTLQPSELMMVYNNTNYSKPAPVQSLNSLTHDWIKAATGRKALPTGLDTDYTKGNPRDSSRVLAENIVALLILPKLTFTTNLRFLPVQKWVIS